MRIDRRWIVGGGAVALGIALVALLRRPTPIVVDAAVVGNRALESTVDADGKTRVRERYVVAAPVSGRIERITLIEGAHVRAGDVVARVRPLPLDSAGMVQARSRVESADALALQAAAESRVATAQAEQRQRELSRAQRLADVGGVAPKDVEDCQLARLEAQEAARGADDRLKAAEADARQARAVLAGQDDGAVTIPVRAPASGRVLRVPERSERIVAAGAPLIELGDPASLEIVVDVLSSDGALVHPGDRVRLAEWGGAVEEEAATLGGRVREIEPSGFTKVSALGVEEQRVNVIVDPDRVPPAVGDGFRVEASIVVWSVRQAVAAPRSALVQAISGHAGWTAFVVQAGRVQEREVRIGHAAGADAEILSGLSSGDTVVVFPSDLLKAGARVRVHGGS